MKKQYILAVVIGVMLICGMILAGCGSSVDDPEPTTSGNNGNNNGTVPSKPTGKPPNTPTGTRKSVNSSAYSTTVTLSWNAVSGATGYYVYRSNASLRYTKIATTSSTSYTDYGGSKTSSYKVSAYNSYGESAEASF